MNRLPDTEPPPRDFLPPRPRRVLSLLPFVPAPSWNCVLLFEDGRGLWIDAEGQVWRGFAESMESPPESPVRVDMAAALDFAGRTMMQNGDYLHDLAPLLRLAAEKLRAAGGAGADSPASP